MSVPLGLLPDVHMCIVVFAAEGLHITIVPVSNDTPLEKFAKSSVVYMILGEDIASAPSLIAELTIESGVEAVNTTRAVLSILVIKPSTHAADALI